MPTITADQASSMSRGVPGREATFSDIVRALRSRWRFVTLMTLLALVASAIFVNVVAPRYTGLAQLLLQTPDTYYTRPGADRASPDASQQIDEQAVASQVQVIQSRDLARDAIKQLGLVGNPEFDKSSDLMRRILSTLGISRPKEGAAEDRVLDEYYDHLLVYPVGKSRIVSIEFRSRDADLAARAANVVSGLYLGLQEDAKKDVARSASNWLGSNIDDLRKRLAESEAKVEAFRSKSGLLSGAGTTTLSAQQLSDMSTQLGAARTAQGDAQAKAQLIRELVKDGRGFEIPDVANNELIRRLIEQRINLRAQLALESRTLLPQHPRMKELNAQLADLEAQIRGAAERTARTLENDSRIAGSRVQSLEAAIDQQKKVVAQANEGEVQLRALDREARIQRDQLETYLARYREASVRDVGSAAPPEARIVSRAVVPQTPSFPKKAPTVVLATIAAFVLSAGLVVAREILSSTPPEPARYRETRPVRRDEEAERRSWASADAAPMPLAATLAGAASTEVRPAGPVTASEPLPELATELTMAPPTPDARYDFADLVDRLRRIDVTGRARRVLVAGVADGAEAADVGRGLALSLAVGERVVVVEIDPSRISEHAPGLTDLVAGNASFTEVIHREPGSQLHRIAVGTGRGESLARQPEGFDVVASALDQTYDWVICMLFAGSDGDLMELLGHRADIVVIASNLEPANQDLVHTYEAAKNSGAPDVIVAREQMLPQADSSVAA